jgi:hypothetical protein
MDDRDDFEIEKTPPLRGFKVPLSGDLLQRRRPSGADEHSSFQIILIRAVAIYDRFKANCELRKETDRSAFGMTPLQHIDSIRKPRFRVPDVLAAHS